MNVHKNARMTVHGRLLLVERVREAGWRVADAAAAAGVSERTAYTWLARWRDGGAAALHDRSSAPAISPPGPTGRDQRQGGALHPDRAARMAPTPARRLNNLLGNNS